MCWHKWTKWVITNQGPITSTSLVSGRTLNVGTLIIQKRVCEKCGYTQIDKQEVMV